MRVLTSNSVRDDVLTEYVITSLVTGFVLEALTPGKVTTVSYVKGIKNLNIYPFLASAPTIYEVLKSVVNDSVPKVRLGYWIKEGVRKLITNQAIGTNTCLGYMILTIPLVYALKEYKNNVTPYELAKVATQIVLNSFDESVADFYEALRVLSPSYANRYYGGIPDIYSEPQLPSKYTIRDILLESSYWDLVAYDVTHYYELTLRAYNYMVGTLTRYDMNLLKAIADTQIHLLSTVLDSEVVRGGAIGTAITIRDFCSLAIEVVKEETSRYILIRDLDDDLRVKNVNTGSIADIVALATSFTLMSVPGLRLRDF